jgi:hypothetical protein
MIKVPMLVLVASLCCWPLLRAQPVAAGVNFGWPEVFTGMSFEDAKAVFVRQGFKLSSNTPESAFFSYTERSSRTARFLTLGNLVGEEAIYLAIEEARPHLVSAQYEAWSLDLMSKYGPPIATRVNGAVRSQDFCHSPQIAAQLIHIDTGVALRFIGAPRPLAACKAMTTPRNFAPVFYNELQWLPPKAVAANATPPSELASFNDSTCNVMKQMAEASLTDFNGHIGKIRSGAFLVSKFDTSLNLPTGDCSVASFITKDISCNWPRKSRAEARTLAIEMSNFVQGCFKKAPEINDRVIETKNKAQLFSAQLSFSRQVDRITYVSTTAKSFVRGTEEFVEVEFSITSPPTPK